MRTFIATAINKSRLSSGIDNEAGVKERTASSSRKSRERNRGAFASAWGCWRLSPRHRHSSVFRNGVGDHELVHRHFEIADHQPGRRRAGHRRGAARTAIGLVAAIPAVIIYNHFSRVTKGYLDLVNKASGAAGRQLSPGPRPHAVGLAATRGGVGHGRHLQRHR